MSRLRLAIRTPEGVVCERDVSAINVEDEAGWFGILPGRRAIIAALPAGLLTFRDSSGEWFVAHSAGLLELRGADCRVLVPEATLERKLEDLADALQRAVAKRRERGRRRAGVMADLEREALRRLASESRS